MAHVQKFETFLWLVSKVCYFSKLWKMGIWHLKFTRYSSFKRKYLNIFWTSLLIILNQNYVCLILVKWFILSISDLKGRRTLCLFFLWPSVNFIKHQYIYIFSVPNSINHLICITPLCCASVLQRMWTTHLGDFWCHVCTLLFTDWKACVEKHFAQGLERTDQNHRPWFCIFKTGVRIFVFFRILLFAETLNTDNRRKFPAGAVVHCLMWLIEWFLPYRC